ncbi:hypothetical protein GGS20DRAFT_103825 [Poronia punctata]|nr:hypothetical protein GGS20DRAFT_103825 [Poronia punctata]
MASNGPTQAEQYQPSAPASTASTNEPANASIGKDEVAWYFVEQYYTTLSKNPDKLHLFYSKHSQFVYGQEGQTANVCVGRQAINGRIKDLDFQNCKVRVSNVDSQASFENIVIQVIGETSNKGSTPKKFVQTFVLAQQPSGYFVLNDILRYIDDEGEEEATEPAEEAEPAVETQASVPATEDAKEVEPAEEQAAEEPTALDAGAVDQKLAETAEVEKTAPVNGDAAPQAATEESKAVPEATSNVTEQADKATTEPEIAQKPAEETPQEPEKPQEPTPTPAAAAAARKPAAPAPAPAPAAPPKPMTWASRAAAAAAAAGPPKVSPVTPLPKGAPVPVPTRPAAASSTTSQTAAPAAQNTEATATTAAAPTKEVGTEWQTAGSDSKRQNRPQSVSGPPAEKEGSLGYVKYVTDKVGRDELEAALAQYGELAYFDINRQKNCAFVEFKTPAGYQAAVAANPHVVNGENIVVEPRRPKAGAYGGPGFGTGRPNVPNRGGRGGFDGNRSGSHGGRGSFGGQGRGGRGGLPRGGRGASQATNV